MRKNAVSPKDRQSVLIVEDDEGFGRLLGRVLRREGFQCHLCHNGGEALSWLAENNPSLLLLDYSLPDITAAQLVERLYHNGRQVAFVIMTGNGDEHIAVEMMKLGARDYLVKSAGSVELLPAVVRGVLEQEKTLRELAATSRKQRESEERLRVAMKNSGIIVAHVDRELRYTWIHNPHSDFITEAVIGRRDDELADNDGARRLVQVKKQVIETGAGVRTEIAFPLSDGTRIYDITAEPLRDESGQVIGATTAAIDITDRKQAEEMLRYSDRKYRRLVENAGEGIAVAQDGFFRLTNPKLSEILGYSKEELIANPFLQFIFPEDHDMVNSHCHGRIRGEEVPRVYLCRVVCKNGAVKWVEINATAFEWDGAPAVLVFFSEITRRKEAEEALKNSRDNLQKTLEGTVNVLGAATETRDPYTAGHQQRVAQLAGAIAREMGLSEEQVMTIHLSGVLHDIGKIYIPSEILCKPGKLNEQEMALIKNHARISGDILKNIPFAWPVELIVSQHHERMDGSGYPDGLCGEEILLEARILAVADVVEAMCSHRPYRAAHGKEAAMQEIAENSGVLYDSDVVSVCLKLFRENRFSFTGGFSVT